MNKAMVWSVGTFLMLACAGCLHQTPSDNRIYFVNPYEDVRWELYINGQRMIHYTKENGKTVASFASLGPRGRLLKDFGWGAAGHQIHFRAEGFWLDGTYAGYGEYWYTFPWGYFNYGYGNYSYYYGPVRAPYEITIGFNNRPQYDQPPPRPSGLNSQPAQKLVKCKLGPEIIYP